MKSLDTTIREIRDRIANSDIIRNTNSSDIQSNEVARYYRFLLRTQKSLMLSLIDFVKSTK